MVTTLNDGCESKHSSAARLSSDDSRSKFKNHMIRQSQLDIMDDDSDKSFNIQAAAKAFVPQYQNPKRNAKASSLKAVCELCREIGQKENVYFPSPEIHNRELIPRMKE